MILAMLLGITLGYLVWSHWMQPSESSRKPPASNWTQLVARIEQGKVKEITLSVDSLAANVVERDRRIDPYTITVPGTAANEEMVKLSRPPKSLFEYNGRMSPGEPWWRRLLISVLPTLLLIGLLVYLFRDMLPGGRNKFSPTAEETKVTFDDVAGIGEAVEELRDVREYLHDPKRFQRLGAKIPKGVLLYGPPGTGKTMLAKAIATEAGVPFYSMAGSDFVEMYAGLGAARVRGLFKQAKQHAPCIVFIDELDAVGRKRGGGGDGGARESDQTLNQVLVEMDGFSVDDEPVVVMGASNLIENLDAALLRPGRFDRLIAISAPDRAGRRSILDVHAKGKPLSANIDLDALARQTAGMTGADLANLLNESALLAARDPDSREIDKRHLEEAMYRIVAGPAKHNRVLSAKERMMTAYHEMGHALLGERLEGSNEVHKISIVPRGDSLGQTFYVSEEDVYSSTAAQMRNEICGLLGGRAAEELMVGEFGTGAANDLQRCTNIAWSMLTHYGFGDSLGFRVITDGAPLSEAQQEAVDAEVQTMIAEEYERAKRLLSEQRDLLEHCAQTLNRVEVLDREEFLVLLAGEEVANRVVLGPLGPLGPDAPLVYDDVDES